MLPVKLSPFGLSIKKLPTAKDYVQNGLVSMWDGIENAGWGTHDDNLRLIDLLQNGYEMPVETIESNHGTVRGISKYRMARITDAVRSVEVVCAVTGTYKPASGRIWTTYCEGSTQYTDVTRYAGLAVGGVSEYPDRVTLGTLYPNIEGGFLEDAFPAALYGTSFSVSFSSNTNKSDIYLNGTYTLQSNVHISETQQNLYFNGQYGLTSYGFNGSIYSFRLYSHTLTASEIATNYAIDKLRFNL